MVDLIVALRKLSTYRKKRDFEKTDEPSGDVKVAPSRQRRFVIQKHAATRLHYDLRLEFDGVFKSWAVTSGWRWRWKTIRSITAISKARSRRASMAAARCSSGTAAIGSPRIRKPDTRRATSSSPSAAKNSMAAGCWCACGATATAASAPIGL